MQDLPAVMSALIDAGKFYYGGWPRNGESLEEYFTTILKSLGGRRAGLMLSGDPKDEEIAELGCEGIMALWHDLQDKYLDRAE
ncbi:MAG: hypothetical protein QF662_07545 [Phycisphaerae bacterium]|nr:hypothetical protein [Phycisphaerae bacterium]